MSRPGLFDRDLIVECDLVVACSSLPGGPLMLSCSDLIAQHQDLGVLPPLPPPRQTQQRHGAGDNQEDQPHAHKPRIIPRPARHQAE
jgi:hypothetical protein